MQDLDAAPKLHRDEDGSVRLRIRIPPDLADAIEAAAGGTPLVRFLRQTIRDALIHNGPGVNEEVDNTGTFARRLFSMQETATMLGVSLSWMKRRVAAHEIVHTRIRGRVFFTSAQIDAMIARGEQPAHDQQSAVRSRRRTTL